VTRHSLFNLN